MSVELTVAADRGQSLEDLMGVKASVAIKVTGISRLNVVQTPIEAEVEFNGKMLKDEVVEKGAYKLYHNETDVFSKTVTIRIFAMRQQWQRWNGDTNEMEKSVLATNVNMDLKDSVGGINLGRPSGYIEDWNALPEATKTLIRSVKRVKVFYGTVSLDNPMDEKGQPLNAADYEDIPFVFDVKNRDSLKQLDTATTRISKKNMLPIMHTIVLSPAIGSIPTGATYGYVNADLGSKVELSDDDNETLKNFLDFIEYTNGKLLDLNSERSGSGLTSEDAALVGDIIQVEDF